MKFPTIDGRAWDSLDAYLFDIDGTLLECADLTHYFAFCHVLREISGRDLNLEGVIAHGNTDIGILRDALSLAAIAEEQWRPRICEMRELMCAYVVERKAEVSAKLLPHVKATLLHLRLRGACVGVATGNLEAIGLLKLERAGLHNLFDFGAFSDTCETRTEVFKNAAARARSIVGAATTVCVIGDTPSDIKAARANGLPVIAVATGIFSAEELKAGGPDICVSSLGELVADC